MVPRKFLEKHYLLLINRETEHCSGGSINLIIFIKPNLSQIELFRMGGQ